MIIPVRCFTCGKVIGHLWQKYFETFRTSSKKSDDILRELGVERYCCRRMLVSHVDLIRIIYKYDLPSSDLSNN